MQGTQRLAALRGRMREEGVDAFLLATGDEFQGEYVAAYAARLTWLTGFDGSAGSVAVTQDRAAFFTDGRYTIQAEMQLPKGVYEMFNSGDKNAEAWLGAHLKPGMTIGVDPWLITASQLRRWEKLAARKEVAIRRLSINPVDALWTDCPPRPDGKAQVHHLEHSGKASADKRREVGKSIADQGADAALLSDPASVCWLLNIRGGDVPYTPVVHAFALLHADGKASLYVEASKIDAEVAEHLGRDVTLRGREDLAADIAAFGARRILLDPDGAAAWFFDRFREAGAVVVEAADPCLMPKACKNAAELEGMRQAHLRDGKAVTAFLAWLKAEAPKGQVTELSAAERLEGFRQESNLYRGPSFATISGFGPNGAIVHYRSTEATNRRLEEGGLFLVDSGGQYPDGTTDITRTVAIGTPSQAMKEAYTRVLKGHIALARCKFPAGTTGSQLDALARYHLWQAGMDYDHGTGHGVGSYLSVHEGPQRISKMPNKAALKPGMILSNEPGYYKAGEFGIRIENLVAVVPVEQQWPKMAREGTPITYEKEFYAFETLTRAPLEERLVLWEMLTYPERRWWEIYHEAL